MIVLGIETSCDETAASVFEGPCQICSNIVSSQFDLHHAYGGVVPELASRRHIEVIDHVVKKSLSEAKLNLSEVDIIAVTTGPGLVGPLLMGVTFAKALSYALQKPLVGVNHLEAHLYAPFLEHPQLKFPLISLIVSGGHTLLVWVKGLGEYQVLGTTFDDAAGEAYDKVAKLLGLGYPGGPEIDRLASKGNPKAIRFPRPMLSKSSLDFSFSGLKTAVLYLLKGYGGRDKNSVKGRSFGSPPAVRTAGTAEKDSPDVTSGACTAVNLKDYRIEDLAASFQEAVVDVLVEKALRALEVTGLKRLALGGGVSANSRLRSHLQELSRERNFELYLPTRTMCTDNAAMIAGLAHARYLAGLKGEPLEANPGLKLEG